MKNASKNTILANEIQLVISLDEGLSGASSEEIRTIRDSFISAIGGLDIGLASCSVTDAFLDARITFGSTLVLGNLVRTAKSVVGRRFAREFPGRPRPFAPGYMVRTLGTAIDPADAVRRLSERGS